MRTRPVVVVVSLACSLAGPAGAASPKVVITSPDNGEIDVAVDIGEIRIEFDQPMNSGGRSVVGGGESFPEISGDLKWADEKTFVITVKLKPDHWYQFSINSDTFKGFRGKGGEAADWYPIRFKTRAAGAAPTAGDVSRDENEAGVAALKLAIEREYAYRDLKKIEWTQE